jgi:hypothetical protein
MVSKILAVTLAVAVLTVGGYTYWEYADGAPCCGVQAQTPEASTGCPAASVSLPCCQEPSRSGPVSLASVEACCEEAPARNGPEVLAVMPREVK